MGRCFQLRNAIVWLLPGFVFPSIALLLSACASNRIPKATLTASDPEAVSIVTASQRSHGALLFATIRDLNVKTAGTWGSLGPRFQPAL